LTVIVKTDLELLHDDMARPVPGAEILSRDSLRETGSLELPSDMVPALDRPEILLLGHAWAPAGGSAVAVRLFVGGEVPLLDKTVHVYGDRAPGGAAPSAFSRIPLVWERAVGGAGTDNPVGRRPGSGGANILSPEAPGMPAGFGPIAPTWPARSRCAPHGVPSAAADILELSDDTQLAWFQAAPPDQRLRSIAGDEWIVVDGMHPAQSRFQSQLPGLAARARLAGPPYADGPADLAMAIDRIVIDMDRLRASVTWRASVVVDPAKLPHTEVVAGVRQPEDAELGDVAPQTVMLDEAGARPGGEALPWSAPGTRAPPRGALAWVADETVTAPAVLGSVPSVVPDDEEEADASGGTAVAPIARVLGPALPFEPTPGPPPAVVDPAVEARSAPLPEAVQPQAEPAPPILEEGARKMVLDTIRAGEALLGVDLAGADLSNLDLAGARLGDADLSGAKLAGSNLRGARLGGAKLGGADLSGADLREADLSRADLTRSTLDEARLDRADLTDAVLTLCSGRAARLGEARADRASFARGRWDDVVFDGASLKGADLSGARLGGASFRGASLVGARLQEAQGEGVSFARADLDGVNATGATLALADLEGAKAARSAWERASLDKAILDDCDLRAATMTRSTLHAATIRGALLDGADLSHAEADGADFTGARLAGANLRQAKLGAAVLARAGLKDANLQRVTAAEARMEEVDLRGASLRFARLRGADLSGARIDGADFRDADLESAKLSGVDRAKGKFGGANLKGATLD
jgi:uncharacterized protein YjbI with pentapeptide repeats